jgi:hypothetical protein
MDIPYTDLKGGTKGYELRTSFANNRDATTVDSVISPIISVHVQVDLRERIYSTPRDEIWQCAENGVFEWHGWFFDYDWFCGEWWCTIFFIIADGWLRRRRL